VRRLGLTRGELKISTILYHVGDDDDAGGNIAFARNLGAEFQHLDQSNEDLTYNVYANHMDAEVKTVLTTDDVRVELAVDNVESKADLDTQRHTQDQIDADLHGADRQEEDAKDRGEEKKEPIVIHHPAQVAAPGSTSLASTSSLFSSPAVVTDEARAVDVLSSADVERAMNDMPTPTNRVNIPPFQKIALVIS
jgi:hypothetical protein